MFYTSIFLESFATEYITLVIILKTFSLKTHTSLLHSLLVEQPKLIISSYKMC